MGSLIRIIFCLFVFLGKFSKFNFHCYGSKFNLLPVLFNNPSGTGCRLFRHFFQEQAAGSLATSLLKIQEIQMVEMIFTLV